MNSDPPARPFLKWAGGKGQLLPAITRHLPQAVRAGSVARYVEPFLGSGAVFFHLAQRFPFREFYLADRNLDLVRAYLAVQREVEGVIEALAGLQELYWPLCHGERADLFYGVRRQYNAAQGTEDDAVTQTARMLFLNRTCFNGLYRVNSRGEFNVPHGRYVRPLICDPENLRAASRLLQRAHVRHADFEECSAGEGAFVYFDPPYRPLSRTASFNAYAAGEFDDTAQLRLAALYRRFDAEGALLMLSNSDPTNEDPKDAFFDRAYEGYSILRIPANRAINSNPSRRGPIRELLILNYPPEGCGNGSPAPYRPV